MSYINEVSIAVSPYIARCNKAIEFYQANNDRLSGDQTKINGEYIHNDGGLFLCIGEGPTEGWGSAAAPLPSLDTYDVENPLLFARFKYMYFVTSDVDGKINVGGLTWTRVAYGSGSDEDYFLNVRNKGARWLYVQFDIQDVDGSGIVNGILQGRYMRQFGIYSNLKLSEGGKQGANKMYFEPKEISSTSTTERRKLDGILELVQNKDGEKFDGNKMVFSYVLEF